MTQTITGPALPPVTRFTAIEARYASTAHSKSGFVTGDAFDATVAVLKAHIAELSQDKARLDSRRIVTTDRDDFGETIITERVGIDLRAAIDKAMTLHAQDQAREAAHD